MMPLAGAWKVHGGIPTEIKALGVRVTVGSRGVNAPWHYAWAYGSKHRVAMPIAIEHSSRNEATAKVA